jgi:hypothetical protein
VRQLRDDPAVRQRSRNGADTSSLRLLLRLIYAARREREGTLPPLLLADEADEVIEDDMEAMASLEDHSDSFPSDLLDSVSDAVARAKFLLAADARASSAEYEGYLARMFTNSFALQAYRDSHARTRQPKAEVGSGVFCSMPPQLRGPAHRGRLPARGHHAPSRRRGADYALLPAPAHSQNDRASSRRDHEASTAGGRGAVWC